MKKLAYFLFSILFVVAVFTTSPAMAQNAPCQGKDPYTSCNTPGNNPLPINNGMFYLLMAGLVIGVLVVNKYKAEQSKLYYQE